MNSAGLNLERAARLAAALSDPTRLRVLRMLGGGERCVCDLQEAVGVYQSRLSFHLRKLKDAGLVTDRREGRWVFYTMCPEPLRELQDVLERIAPEAGALPEATARCC